MKTLKCAKLLIVIAIIMIIAVPVCALIEFETNADSTTQTIETYNGDYVFFVVEENKVPLSAVPTMTQYDNSLSLRISFIVSISVLLLIYSFWYATSKRYLSVLSKKTHYSMRKNYENVGFLHPINLYQSTKDAEYRITQKYVF